MRSETFRILAVLSAGGAESTEILDRLERTHPGDAPSMATFYRRLKEAIDVGWIDVEALRPTGPGRPAQRYRLTEAGLSAARAEAIRWRGLTDVLLDEGTG